MYKWITGTPPPVTRVTRPPRSRSAGGKETPSPQQSPFRRNRSTNQSSRQPRVSSVVSRSTTPTPQMSRRSPSTDGRPTPVTTVAALGRNNTWNATGGRHWTGKQRSQITADTFCQQVADIISQYAALSPSPRKDSKPDSAMVTRIPAPVQRS